MKSIFITGTDTDIGKTFVSVGLCLALEHKNKKTGYFKPLQSGAYLSNGELKAPDIEELKKYSNLPCGYSYLLKGEVSPYLTSKLNNVEIDMNKIKNDFVEFSKPLDYTIVEGAGGLYCPAAKNRLFCDVIKELNTEIIVVTTAKLGRLNHLLMTLECAKVKDIKVKGVIINGVSDIKTESEKNFIEELKDFSDVEILLSVPLMKNPNKNDIINVFKDVDI